MSAFWYGIIIGGFAGTMFGAMTMAILAMSKDSVSPPSRGGVIDLNDGDYRDLDRFSRDKGDQQQYRR